MDNAAEWYALTAVVLFLKMFALALYQGRYRIGKRTFVVPEDARLAGTAPAQAELPEVERAARAWRNDVENIPVFLALGVAYVWVDAGPAAAPWLFTGFAIARVAHTVCYLRRLQPWRTVAYGIGALITLGMCLQILLALA
ncbi:MAPEG family protein [Aquisalimonas lutea]|uniref:MAPEG family protein n=1 Tax=Aquisalimonas lutea TaxID=1327750 RepID=UPI0025B5FB37|nr:MAPEG family protein [Aquisalimonas lutea]MDN3518122.1 MAPEG family protein [Aquisalimonas lutea]